MLNHGRDPLGKAPPPGGGVRVPPGFWLGLVGFAWEQMQRQARGFGSAQLPPCERNGVQSSAIFRPVGLLVGLTIKKVCKLLF